MKGKIRNTILLHEARKRCQSTSTCKPPDSVAVCTAGSCMNMSPIAVSDDLVVPRSET